MRHLRISRFSLRRPEMAGLAALLAAGISGTSGAAGPDDALSATNAAASACASPGGAARRTCQYSIINLDPDPAGNITPFLNERGEAAVGSYLIGTRRFFDGERLHDIGSLGGGFTDIAGLNDKGVVVGSSDTPTPHPESYGFRWTVAGGMRAIPASRGGFVSAGNDHNQVVGTLNGPDISARAARWDPNGRVVNLGPLPFSLSVAQVINDRALAGGYTDFADGTIHASLWDSAGKAIDLGTLGGSRAFTEYVNNRNEAAGYSDNATNDNELGFYWSARDGVVPTGAQGFPTRLVSALNDRGEMAGDTDVPGGSAAYLWSRSRGLTLLPRGGTALSDVFDLNNRTQMVGGLGNGFVVERAVRWNGLASPVDLNTLLYRPPAGLVLYAGLAINDAGTILAISNAGLVMLRPGTRGTDAPVLGPVTGLPFAVDVGQDVHLAFGFVDNSATQTHTAVVDWDDGCPSPAPVVAESRGTGQVAFQHRFCTAGYFFLQIRVTDSGGRTTELFQDVIVNPPGLATVGGRGSLARGPASGGARTLPLHFAFWTPVGNAAPAQATNNKAFVRFDGPFQFRSDHIGTAAGSGQGAHLEGTGNLNGRPGYRFVVDATDGGGQQAGSGDSLRVRITHAGAGGKEVVDYDNGVVSRATARFAAVHPNGTPIENGDIVVRH